jgi:hypothetical protein
VKNLMTETFHKKWLIVTAIVVGSFGPVFTLGTRLSTAGPARWTLDFLNGPGGNPQTFEPVTARFLTALTGGFLFGWGVMIFCLRTWAYDHAPEGVRRSVVAGLLAWFVLDSTGSIASGNAWNAGYNVIVLLLGVGPLWRPATRSASTNG